MAAKKKTTRKVPRILRTWLLVNEDGACLSFKSRRAAKNAEAIELGGNPGTALEVQGPFERLERKAAR